MSSKLTWTWVVGYAGITALATVSSATERFPETTNPYSVISDRNVFHLNPPPPPPEAEAPKPVELPKVALTGIMGKGNLLRALLAIPPKDNKETVTYLTLEPGQRAHGVELVRIHLDKAEVEIINSGTAQTLNRSNSLAIMASAPHQPGAPAGEKVGGIHRGMAPAFPPSIPPGPATAAAQGGGSSLVIGGNSGGSSGAFVSGGSSYGGGNGFGGGSGGIGVTSTGGTGNNVGNAIASALFNPSTGRYQMPTPTAPPLPPIIQVANMLKQEGGPPVPPSSTVQDVVDALNGAAGGPPPPNSPPVP